MNFHERKKWRTRWYFRCVYGWRLKTCTACSGSGRYDHHGSPRCGNCDGTGKSLYQTEKGREMEKAHA